MRRTSWLVVCSLLASTAAAQITVPGTYPDPQTAVDSVAPGSTIVIQGGTWDPLQIRQPVTLVGDPAPTFTADARDGIELLGPGSGEIVLVNIQTYGITLGSRAGAGIAGGGFDELHVYESSIEAAEFPGFTGLGYGESGIDTSVPLVWIERSVVRGSKTDIDGTPIRFAPDAEPGIDATGTVVVLDSRIYGANNGVFVWASFGGPVCPPSCPSGRGGAAVRSPELYSSQSLFYPGAGATWIAEGGTVNCCYMGPGLQLEVNNHVQLLSGLNAAYSPSIGTNFTITWNTSGPAWLILSYDLAPPVRFNFGPWFLGSFGNVQSMPVAAPGSKTYAIPNDPAWIGREASFQLYDEGIGLTRPVSVVVKP